MIRFVRVAHRQGWEVEVLVQGGVAETSTHGSRQQALDHAMALSPEWIEVGDIVGLDTPEQHHEWSTLRRRRDGSYVVSPLRWGSKDFD